MYIVVFMSSTSLICPRAQFKFNAKQDEKNLYGEKCWVKADLLINS